jgi:YVTN family beta-propeller protein
MSLILVMTMATGPSGTGAATVVREWKAKVGTSGANGTATMQAYTTGTGATILKLVKLRASTTLPVVISKGTCSAVGATIVKLPSVKSTSAGALSKTLGLTAAQVTAIKNASAAGKMAFRIGSSSTGGVKCGAFVIVPRPPVVGARIAVGAFPEQVVAASGGVFVTNWWDSTISKIDPSTNTVLLSIPVQTTGNAGPFGIAFGEGALWVTVTAYDSSGSTSTAGSLLRIDPGSGQTLATIPVGRDPYAVVTSPGAVWVANSDDGTIVKIDSATNAIAGTVTLSTPLYGLTFGEGSVWASSGQAGSVARIDPATATVTATILTVGSPDGLTIGAGSVWVANWGTTGQSNGVVSRIDPISNAVVRTIPVGVNPAYVAFGGGYLWVGLYGSSTLVQVDPVTNAVKASLTTGPQVVAPTGQVVGLRGLAATDDSVWAVQPLMPPVGGAYPPPGQLARVYF